MIANLKTWSHLARWAACFFGVPLVAVVVLGIVLLAAACLPDWAIVTAALVGTWAAVSWTLTIGPATKGAGNGDKA